MILKIKKDFRHAFPANIRDYEFTYVSSAPHPTLHKWVILAVGPDGEFYAFERQQVKVTSPLEVILA